MLRHKTSRIFAPAGSPKRFRQMPWTQMLRPLVSRVPASSLGGQTNKGRSVEGFAAGGRSDAGGDQTAFGLGG